MHPAIAKRQPLHRRTAPLVATLLITVLVITAIPSPASAQTIPDAGESNPTAAIAQATLVDEPNNKRSLLPLGIGIVVAALATYLAWGGSFLFVLEKGSLRRRSR